MIISKIKIYANANRHTKKVVLRTFPLECGLTRIVNNTKLDASSCEILFAASDFFAMHKMNQTSNINSRRKS